MDVNAPSNGMTAKFIKLADVVIEYAVYVFVLAMLVSTSLWQLALAAILLFWTARHVAGRGTGLGYLREPLVLAGLAFCTLVLISTFYASDTLEGLRVYKNTIGASMILLLAIPDIFRDERRQRRLFATLAYAAAVVVLVQVGRYVVDFLQDGSIRNYSHYRKMAEPFLFYLPFALAFAFLSAGIKASIFWIIVMISQVVLLLLTGARSAWIGVAAALLVWLILKPNRTLFMASAAATAIAALVMLAYDSPLSMRISEGVLSASTMERVGRLWPQTYSMIATSPFLGHGYGDYYGELLRQSAQHPEWVVLRPGPYGPHNNYLEIWFSAGIATLAVLIYLCARLVGQMVEVVRSSAQAPTAYFALATLCAFTAHFLVRGFVEDVNWRPLGVLAGIAAALTLRQRVTVPGTRDIRST
ncbi:MAG: hypothetical protein EPN55_06845 [Gammaproteobacteria bacterium]|nr:MAG: hypothetical protein EPN55_06845 [Gammaproteobacteria bacterium]